MFILKQRVQPSPKKMHTELELEEISIDRMKRQLKITIVLYVQTVWECY